MTIISGRREYNARFRRGAMLLCLAGLLGALASVALLGGRYLMERQSGTATEPLPALVAVASAAPPRFLFSINGVSRPLGVAVSPRGDRIYVTESDGQHETKLFDRDGHPLGALNPPGSEPGSRVPVYVSVSPQGNVYVTDRQAGTVHSYSAGGDYLGRVEPPGGQAIRWAPLALAFDGQGNLLVTDTSPGKHGVTVFGPDGTLLRQFGTEGTGAGEFSYPNGVAVDSFGHILVSDSNNGRVAVLDSQGNSLWTISRGAGGGSFGLPRGLAVDSRDRLYVVDAVNHNFSAFAMGERDMKPLFTLGAQGIRDGAFNFPNGLAVDVSGRLYITDRENNRVQVWTY